MQSNLMENTPAQERFDQMYITASEVMKELGVTRSNLFYARNTGKLPPPIVANDGQLIIWERETVRPYLDAWKSAINYRRG